MVRNCFGFLVLGLTWLPQSTFGIRPHPSRPRETIRIQTSRSRATDMVNQSSQAIDQGTAGAHWLRDGFRALFNAMKRRIDETLAENAGDTLPYALDQTPRHPEAAIGIDLINASLPLEYATDGLRFHHRGDHTLVLSSAGTQTSVAYSPSLSSIDMSTKISQDSTHTSNPKSATYSARLEKDEAGDIVVRYKSRRIIKSERAKTKWDGEAIPVDFSVFDRADASMGERLEFFKNHALGRSISPRGRKNILGLVGEIASQLTTAVATPIAYDVDDELYDRGIKIALAPGFSFKVEVSPTDATSSREANLIFEQPGRTNKITVNATPAKNSVKTTLQDKAPKAFVEGDGFVIHELEMTDESFQNTRLVTALSDISVRPMPKKLTTSQRAHQ